VALRAGVGEIAGTDERGAGEEVTRRDSAAVEHELVMSMLDPFALLDPILDPNGQVTDFRFRQINGPASVFLRESAARLPETEFSQSFADQSGVELIPRFRDVLRTGKPFSVDDFAYLDPRGSALHLEVRCWPMAGGLAVTWRDRTAALELVSALRDSEEHFRLLAENTSDVVIHLRDGTIAWVSPSIHPTLGWEPAEIAGRPLNTVLHPDDRRLALAEARVRHDDQRFRVRVLDHEGDFHWFDSSVAPLVLPTGNQDGWVATFRLVDDEVAAEEQLHQRATYDALTGLLNRNEALTRIAEASQQSPRTGRNAAVLFCDLDKFKSINDTYGHAAGDEVLRTIAQRIKSAVRGGDMVARLAGDELLVLLTGVHDLAGAVAVAEKVRAAAANPIGFGLDFIEATLSIGVAMAASGEGVDALIARADAAMLRAKDLGRNQVIAVPARGGARRVLVVDDDAFSLDVAAELLRQLDVDEVCLAASGERALAAATNELTVPDLILCDINMPGMDGIEFLRHLAHANYGGGIALTSGAGHQLRESVADLALVHGLQLVGSLAKPLERESLREVLLALDPGHITAPVEEVKGVRFGRLTPDEVSRGMAEGCVDIHVQPRVDLATRKVVAVEALLRWLDPERGILSPQAIVPIAEAHGMVEELTLRVFRLAVEAVAQYDAAGLDLRVGVNVSTEDLTSLALPDRLVAIAKDAGVQPRQVILEVTEGRLMERVSSTLEVIGRLRLRGFGISIDDYGVGYSNLGKLKQLPVTEVKVDRAFVSGADSDAVQRVILESSLALGHSLGLRVVCEGVEQLEEWELLQELGCDEAQGYFIARPMPVADLPEWKARWEATWQ
jgi:diguanylate cyclase (GGDEF)-like protein/PAS domain S-box-containing protein